MIRPEHINRDYIVDKMNSMPGHFQHLMAERRYPEAKDCYDTMVTLAVFMDLPEANRIELFGNRPYAVDGEDMTEGLFPEEMVQKAYYECVVKRDLGREDRPYRHPLQRTRWEDA